MEWNLWPSKKQCTGYYSDLYIILQKEGLKPQVATHNVISHEPINCLYQDRNYHGEPPVYLDHYPQSTEFAHRIKMIVQCPTS